MMYDLSDPKSALSDFLSDYREEANCLSHGIDILDEAIDGIEDLVPLMKAKPHLANKLSDLARDLRKADSIIWRRYSHMVLGSGSNGCRRLDEIIDALSADDNPEDDGEDEEYE